MEYAKYIPVEGLDVSGLTDSIANKVFTIGQDRQAKKTELANLQQELLDKSVIPMTDNAVINDHINKITSEFQDGIMDKYLKMTRGEASPDEFKRFGETAMRGIETYAKYANSLDERFQNYAKRQASGDGSAAELEYARLLEEITNLNNVQRVDENGRIVVDVLDANGKVKQTVGLDYLNKPGVFLANKLKLAENLTSAMDKWQAQGMFQMLSRDGSITWESLRDNPDWQNASRRLAVAQMAADGGLSLLVDHGGVSSPIFVYSQDDAKQKIDEEIKQTMQLTGRTKLTEQEIEDIEKRTILIDSRGKAVLTEDQKKIAFETAMDRIEMMAAPKLNLDVNKGNRPSSSGGDKDLTFEQKAKQSSWEEGYKISVDAMLDAPESGSVKRLEDFAKQSGINIKAEKKMEGGKWGVRVTFLEPQQVPKLGYYEWLETAEGKAAWKRFPNKDSADDKKARRQMWEDWGKTHQKVSYEPTDRTKFLTKGIDLSEYVFPGYQGQKSSYYKGGEAGSTINGMTYADQKRAWQGYKKATNSDITFENWVDNGMPSGTSNNNSGTTTNNNTSTGLSGGTVR